MFMKKHLHVSADPFPPYQYIQEDGTMTGIDYDVVVRTFEKAGYTVTVDLYDNLLAALDAGKAEAAFQVQPTPERLEKYIFSKKLRDAVTEVVTHREGLQLGSYAEIETLGLVIGVIDGYTNGPEIDALPAKCKKTYPNAAALLKGISAAEVDLGVYDKGVKEFLMKQNGITNIYPIDNLTFLRPLHVVFFDKALCDEFDAHMD